VSVPLGRADAVVGCGHSTLAHFKPLSEVVSQLRVGSEQSVASLGRLLPGASREGYEYLLKLVGELVAFRALEVC
jgi:hypothetical protein